MNFLLDEDQQQLFDAVLDFAVTESDGGARRMAFEGDTQAIGSIWRGFCELGVAGLVIPSQYGGLGLTMIELALASEALGYAGAPGPAQFHNLASLAIALGADEDTKARLLPALATGERCATLAWGDGDGRWPLSSDAHPTVAADPSIRKHHVVCAELASVFVIIDGGGSVMVSEHATAIDPQACADPCRPLSSVEFGIDQCVKLDQFAGDLGSYIRDGAFTMLAADSFGAARRCLDMTVAYAKIRKQFGVLIGSFQGVKYQLADLAAEIEAARGLYWYAALATANRQADTARIAALAKAHTTELATHVARETAKLHGGIGFTWEHDLHIWLRRAMVNSAMGGGGNATRRRVALLASWQSEA